jgi:hypothetical protein
VQFRILGPLEVLDDRGRPLALGGAKQRALLAALLLHAGQVVSADRLIDELWGEEPPESARNVLQVYVANLRKTSRRAGTPPLGGVPVRTSPRQPDDRSGRRTGLSRPAPRRRRCRIAASLLRMPVWSGAGNQLGRVAWPGSA